MNTEIYREFNISVQRTIEKEIRHEREHTYGLLHIELLHRPTGKTFSFEDRGINADILIARAILKHFPDTRPASSLRNEHGLSRCKLNSGWDVDIGGSLHTALRKCCDSRASSFWWNLIHDLPPFVFQQLCKRSVVKLAEVKSPTYVRTYAKAVKAAWEEVLEEAAYFHIDSPRTLAQQCKEKGWPDLSKELTLDDSETFKKGSFMAHLALEYLSMDDWEGMLGYLVDYNVEDTANQEQGTADASEI